MTDLRLISREFLTEFIYLYKNNPCLWKIKSKEYSDKRKKSAAYDVMIRKLREVDPSASRDAVIKKINSLRTCYRKERRKFLISLKSGETGDIYKPNLWYYDLFAFLSDQETSKEEGVDNLSFQDSQEEFYEDYECKQDVFVTANDNADLCRPDSAASVSSMASVSVTDTKRATKRKVFENEDSVDIKIHRGKYRSFGQYIAEELEDLPSEMAIYCKRLICEAIFHAQIGKLNENSKIA